MKEQFLPVNKKEMACRGWDAVDFVYVCGDAYVDHPSFGAAIITRMLEAQGFRIGFLAQPDYKSADAFREFGRPRLGFLVSSGNIDSMVAHYTVSKKKRSYDYYSPAGKAGLRPDRAVIVYSNRIREAYGDVPIILGGLEASLRRFAHYDYWSCRVRRSVLVDSRADILTYGMGEKIISRIAELLARGIPIKKIRDVRGTVYLSRPDEKIHFEHEFIGEYDTLKENKAEYARAFGIQYKNQDAISGKALVEGYGDKILVQNPPMPPLEREELDRIYALPFVRDYHPSYKEAGGVPAIEEVKFSITHNRGCFGACNFCALAFHQGRTVRSRSEQSVIEEAKKITELDGFKGYIHDIGGPTANFRYPACKKQIEHGVCADKRCLAPTPCKNLEVDHKEYMQLLSEVEKLPKIKKVFVRSGIRFDYLMLDSDDSFFKKLVRDHVSGQLKVAPEHCSRGVLNAMGKAPFSLFCSFEDKYFDYCKEIGREQYIVPYLMSSHPGSDLSDAIELALMLKARHIAPEQVQDFYPTPGTVSTVMYYTGIDPLSGKRIYVCTDYHEKQLQRALLQYNRPSNAPLVREALRLAGREDLIGYGRECLVRPERESSPQKKKKPTDNRANGKHTAEKHGRDTKPSRSGTGARADSRGFKEKSSHKQNGRRGRK